MLGEAIKCLLVRPGQCHCLFPMKNLRFRTKFLSNKVIGFEHNIDSSGLNRDPEVRCTATVIDGTLFPRYLRKIDLLYFVLFFNSLFARAKPEKKPCNSRRIRQCAIMTNNPVRKTYTLYKQQKLSSKHLQSVTRYHSDSYMYKSKLGGKHYRQKQWFVMHW